MFECRACGLIMFDGSDSLCAMTALSVMFDGSDSLCAMTALSVMFDGSDSLCAMTALSVLLVTFRRLTLFFSRRFSRTPSKEWSKWQK